MNSMDGWSHTDVAESYRLEEVARICGGVHISTVWRWILSGVSGVKLKSVKLGGKRYVTKHDLDLFLAKLNPADTEPDQSNVKPRDDLAKRLAESGV